jgi:proteasome accessory factor C
VSGATDQLPRLLALVPWLLAHPDTSIEDAAHEFGVTAEQLRADVTLLWMCGLPGYGPGDLIDVVWEGDRVTLSNAEEIARPLRLTPEEALALVAALRALSDVPGVVAAGAVDRALAKLESAAGTAVDGGRVVVATTGTPAVEPAIASAVTDALARGRRLRLRYWVPARDEPTERDVDPIRLFTADGAAYLVGWCHRVEDLRTFRLDRILAAAVLDADAAVPAEVRDRSAEAGMYRPAPDDREVAITLDAPARWVADYFPCERVRERPDGGLDVTVRARDDAWVRRTGLGLAGVGRVTDPPALAEDIRSAARATLALYAEPEGEGVES